MAEQRLRLPYPRFPDEEELHYLERACRCALQELAAEQRAHAETRQKLLAEQSAAAVQNLIHGDAMRDWRKTLVELARVQAELERSKALARSHENEAATALERETKTLQALHLALEQLAAAIPVLEACDEAKRRLLVMIESLEADEDGTTDNDLLLVDLDGIRSTLARRQAQRAEPEAYHGIPEGENGNDWPDGTPEEVKRCIAWTGCPAALSCWHYLKERPRRVTALCEACTEASSRMQKQKEKPSP